MATLPIGAVAAWLAMFTVGILGRVLARTAGRA